MRKKWTKEDEEYLKNNYGILNIEDIEKKLSRSKNSIYRKANKLYLMKDIRFTEYEIKIITENYPHMLNKDIIDKYDLKRNAKSLGDFASKHNIKKTDKCIKYMHDIQRVRINVICDYCGKTFTKTPAEMDSKHHYCSTKCNLNDYKGNRNPNWKGGIISLRKLLRNNTYYWRKNVISQYNSKCFITQKDFEVVHHLYGFEAILNDVLDKTRLDVRDDIGKYSKEEISIIINEFNVMQNNQEGICLTNEIHRDFHKKYGYRNNTAEQFKEYCKIYHKKDFTIKGE